MRIVFFGTPVFASEILSFLLDQIKQQNQKKQAIEICAIVTQPDREKNHLHIAEVKRLHQTLNLSMPLFQPEKASNPEFIQEISVLKPDLFIVAAYGQILKKALLDIPVKGAINIHSSLLPKYRGAAPMHRTLIAGEKTSGVTIMQMNEKMDEGDILNQSALRISEEMNLGDLQEGLIKLSGPLLMKTVEEIAKGTLKPQKQDHALATYAPKIKPEELWLDWKLSAQDLHNRIRAFAPFPGARCWIEIGAEGNRKQLKVLKSQIVDLKGVVGEVLKAEPGRLIVACGAKALEVQVLKLEGKRELKAADFLRGLREPISFVVNA